MHDGLAHEIFEASPAPTLIVDDDLRLLQLNRAARTMLAPNGDATSLLMKHGGEALRCVHSYGPGGCGRQDACRDCGVRGSVRNALESGRVRRTRSFLRLRRDRGETEVCVLVSATRLVHGGPSHVLLTLEDVSDVQLKDVVIRAERALRLADERAAALARFPEENPEPVLRVRGDLTLLYALAVRRAGGAGLRAGSAGPGGAGAAGAGRGAPRARRAPLGRSRVRPVRGPGR